MDYNITHVTLSNISSAKRQKYTHPVPANTTRKPRGPQLSRFLEMPLDIGSEIYGHLYPRDLLQVARTTKQIRRFLMHCSSRFIWRKTLERVGGLPECPPDMTEPQYASLMFESHCHYCLEKGTQTIVWLTRKRVCKGCFPTHHQRSNHIRFDSKYIHVPPKAWRFVELSGSIIHKSSFTPVTRRDGPVLIANLEMLQDLARSISAIQFNPDHLQRWLEQVEINHQRKVEITEPLKKWYEDRPRRRSEELAEVRRKRLDAIVEKLQALGWGDEISNMDLSQLSGHKLVKVSRELSDRAWDKLEHPLVAFMEDIKGKRLEEIRLNLIKDRREAFRDFLESSPRFSVVPVVEASQVGPIQALIEDSSPEVEVNEASFHPFATLLLRFSKSWATSQYSALLQLMRASSLAHSASDYKDLMLATTFFHCDGYDEPIHFQEIFTHPSLFRRRWGHSRRSKGHLFDDFKQEMWNTGNRLSFHEQAFTAARAVLTACIPCAHPGTTTALEMDQWNPLFECTSCYASHGRLIMTWRQAVLHALKVPHNSINPPRWLFVHVVERHYAKAVEAILSEAPRYRCYICRAIGTHTHFKTHMAAHHPSDKASHIIPVYPSLATRVPIDLITQAPALPSFQKLMSSINTTISH